MSVLGEFEEQRQRTDKTKRDGPFQHHPSPGAPRAKRHSATIPFLKMEFTPKAIRHVRSCHGTAAKQHEVNKKQRIMQVSRPEHYMLFLHLSSATDDCTSLAFQTMGVRDLAVAIHHGHRCSKSNQLLRTNGFISRALRSSCAMLHHSNLGLHLDPSIYTQQVSHNKFRTTRPVLHPTSIVPDIDLQPSSQEFSCHDDFLHAVESRTCCALTSMPPNFLLHRAALGTAHPSWMLCSSQRAVVQ